jgi:acyl-coenzyme A thioesterase PaaI-like protein
MTPATAQTFLTQNFAPWVRALDITITEMTTDRTTLTIPITPDLMRGCDILPGQAIAARA